MQTGIFSVWISCVSGQFSLVQFPLRNPRQTATFDLSWMYGHSSSDFEHFPNLQKKRHGSVFTFFAIVDPASPPTDPAPPLFPRYSVRLRPTVRARVALAPATTTSAFRVVLLRPRSFFRSASRRDEAGLAEAEAAEAKPFFAVDTGVLTALLFVLVAELPFAFPVATLFALVGVGMVFLPGVEAAELTPVRGAARCFLEEACFVETGFVTAGKPTDELLTRRIAIPCFPLRTNFDVFAFAATPTAGRAADGDRLETGVRRGTTDVPDTRDAGTAPSSGALSRTAKLRTRMRVRFLNLVIFAFIDRTRLRPEPLPFQVEGCPVQGFHRVAICGGGWTSGNTRSIPDEYR